MGTIIQDFGPIYGEVVNGTVQGRPNGSVYVPISNTITIQKNTNLLINVLSGTENRVRFCNDSGTYIRFGLVAESQDIASNMRVVLASDPGLTTILDSVSFNPGQFNFSSLPNIGMDFELDADDTYYVAGQLMNNGVPVATSTVIECMVYSP